MMLDIGLGSESRARHWVLDRATDAGVPVAELPLIALLSGELIANAVRHGPAGGAVEVEARARGARFGVVVFDESAEAPHVCPPGPTAISGRGMQLVDALSADWGYASMGPDSKAVWFWLTFVQRPPLLTLTT